MSLFIRLSTVAAIAVLLRGVPATVVITAPSTVTDNIAGLETREQGPTAWICSALAVNSPWTSYANIRGYLEGGNVEKKDYSSLVLYPVMELFHASESRLCVYLPAEDHCYPPAPSMNQVKAVKQLTKRNYYAIRFWGQASDARVQYYRQKLTAALNTLSKAAKFDLFFLSYFSDHVREVRFDTDPTAVRKSAEPSAKSGSPICPASPGTTMQIAGSEYLLAKLKVSRLSMFDVLTSEITMPGMGSIGVCATNLNSKGGYAFSVLNKACKLYMFDMDFCPCETGDFEIYFNKKIMEEKRGLPVDGKTANDMKKMVIYTQFPMTTGPYWKAIQWKPFKEDEFAACQNLLRDSPDDYLAAIMVGKQCHLTNNIDAANCNQTCRGKPAEAVVMKQNPNIGPPFLISLMLDYVMPAFDFMTSERSEVRSVQHTFSSDSVCMSLCSQTISIPIIARTNASKVHFFSHAGFGCYAHPEVKTAKDEDCVVHFEKAASAKTIEFQLEYIDLDCTENDYCDLLIVYKGYTTKGFAMASYFNGNEVALADDAFTLNFQRLLNKKSVSGKLGFKISFRSLA